MMTKYTEPDMCQKRINAIKWYSYGGLSLNYQLFFSQWTYAGVMISADPQYTYITTKAMGTFALKV